VAKPQFTSFSTEVGDVFGVVVLTGHCWLQAVIDPLVP
jgi:hypothetical protein